MLMYKTLSSNHSYRQPRNKKRPNCESSHGNKGSKRPRQGLIQEPSPSHKVQTQQSDQSLSVNVETRFETINEQEDFSWIEQLENVFGLPSQHPIASGSECDPIRIGSTTQTRFETPNEQEDFSWIEQLDTMFGLPSQHPIASGRECDPIRIDSTTPVSGQTAENANAQQYQDTLVSTNTTGQSVYEDIDAILNDLSEMDDLMGLTGVSHFRDPTQPTKGCENNLMTIISDSKLKEARLRKHAALILSTRILNNHPDASEVFYLLCQSENENQARVASEILYKVIQKKWIFFTSFVKKEKEKSINIARDAVYLCLTDTTNKKMGLKYIDHFIISCNPLLKKIGVLAFAEVVKNSAIDLKILLKDLGEFQLDPSDFSTFLASLIPEVALFSPNKVKELMKELKFSKQLVGRTVYAHAITKCAELETHDPFSDTPRQIPPLQQEIQMNITDFHRSDNSAKKQRQSVELVVMTQLENKECSNYEAAGILAAKIFLLQNEPPLAQYLTYVSEKNHTLGGYILAKLIRWESPTHTCVKNMLNELAQSTKKNGRLIAASAIALLLKYNHPQGELTLDRLKTSEDCNEIQTAKTVMTLRNTIPMLLPLLP